MSDSIEYKIPENMTTHALADIKPTYTIRFSNAEGEQVGTLDFNGPGLAFEGNAEMSAIIFVDWVAKKFESRLKEEYERGLKDGGST
jgi:hypothetical protein